MTNPTMSGSAAANRRNVQRKHAAAISAMLAALQAQKQFWLEASQRGTLEAMADTIHPDEMADMRATLDAAIAQAKAAGITAQS